MNNLVRGNGSGIAVSGTGNAIEWNSVMGQTNYAINITGINNIYSYNHTKENGSGIAAGGAGNTDAGGNF
jgi:hypothetical protein